MKHLIYALSDPRTNEIRYVGLSNQGLKRPFQHRAPSILCRDTNLHKVNWIKSLLKIGKTYKVYVLYQSDCPMSLGDIEIFWIQELRQRGHRLTNILPGGEHSKHTPETRAKIGAAHRGRKHSAEWNRKNGLVHKGQDMTKCTEAARLANIGRKMKPFSSEHKAQISAARKAQTGLQKRTFEQKQHMSNAQAKRSIERIDLRTGEALEFNSISEARRQGYCPKFRKNQRKYAWRYLSACHF